MAPAKRDGVPRGPGDRTVISLLAKPAARGTHGVFVSVPAAARALGCTRNTVYNKIARGALVGVWVADRLVVRRASLNRCLKRSGKATL